MTKVQLVRAWSRARWQRSARAAPFLLVCLAMVVLGPTAAFAVSSSGTGGAGLPTGTTSAPVSSAGAGNPFARRGMWIWMLSDTDGGNLKKIISQAKSYGIRTLYIKSGDGSSNWSQFNSTLTSDLHKAGLKVCAWQYVYGNDPVQEAKVGDDAVKEGANCLLINAETAYQGKYVSAQIYMHDLRAHVGSKFPVALAGFPYVGDHPSFPYSVFLGAGGAQYDAPQMYWTDIGTSVETIYATTYSYNRIYGRPIYPIGQLYPSGPEQNVPTAGQIESFNKLARLYKAGGSSWYDWQSADKTGLSSISKIGTVPAHFKPGTSLANVRDGDEGDLVIWAQEHLDGWIHKSGAHYGVKSLLTVDGDFGKDTLTAVKGFQIAHGLNPSGVIGINTWNPLLRVTPVKVKWVNGKSGQAATVTAAARSGRTVSQGGKLVELVPRSAKLKAKRNELRGNVGQGRP